MSIASTFLANMSIYAPFIDILAIHVDSVDTTDPPQEIT